MDKTKHIAYLGLGSNLGDGPANLRRAIDRLDAADGVGVISVSDFVESEPWGFVSDHRFTNAVAAVATTLTPLALLDVTQEIEHDMGRVSRRQSGEAYADRIIDIDILTYEDVRWNDERLTLPHPHIAERDFVRVPLAKCQENVAKILAENNND